MKLRYQCFGLIYKNLCLYKSEIRFLFIGFLTPAFMIIMATVFSISGRAMRYTESMMEIPKKTELTYTKSKNKILYCFNFTGSTNYHKIFRSHLPFSQFKEKCDNINDFFLEWETDSYLGGVLFTEFNVEKELYNYTIMYNNSMNFFNALDGSDSSLLTLNQVVINSVQKYLSKYYPHKYNQTDLNNIFYEELILDSISSFLTTQPFLLSSGISFLVPFFVHFIVTEKSTKMKDFLIMSGVLTPVYWLSHLVCDAAITITVLFIEFFCVGIIGGEPSFATQIFASITLFVSYAPLLMTFTYLTTFLYKRPETAVANTSILISLVLGLSYILFGFVLNFEVPLILQLAISLIPLYAFNYGLILLGLAEREGNPISFTDMIMFRKKGLNFSCLLLLIYAETILFFFIILGLETLRFYKKMPRSVGVWDRILRKIGLRKTSRKKASPSGTGTGQGMYFELQEEDGDEIELPNVILETSEEIVDDSNIPNNHQVNEEVIHIEEKKNFQADEKGTKPLLSNTFNEQKQGGPKFKSFKTKHDKLPLLNLENINKTFSTKGQKKKVLDEVYLKVMPGQIYGLLGPNGAGKSTLLNIICGIHGADKPRIPKGGIRNTPFTRIEINGKDIFKNPVHTYSNLSVCPQESILWQHLSVRNHLRIFSMLRTGKCGSMKEVIELFDLKEHLGKKTKNLSGGYKRKLQIALAFIGLNPEYTEKVGKGKLKKKKKRRRKGVILLDEPTTSIDVHSRRFVWRKLLELRKNNAILLTTHSMEEADSICSSIGILVNGKMMTEGTSQQLKNKYGCSFTLTCTTKENTDRSIVEEFIEREIKDAKKINSVGRTLHYQIMKKKEVPLSELFRIIEDNKQENNIIDFTISQTSLLEVFLNFARLQKDE